MDRLVIFDLDGTLLNTIADLGTATNYALQQFGYVVHDIDAYRFMVGNGINKLFERALPEGERTAENVLKIRGAFVPYYDRHNADFTLPYDGIEALLEALESKGFKLAVASNKYQAATSKLVDKFFGFERFAAVYGQRDEIPSKPSPAVIETIIGKTGVSKENVIYIGDSDVDMQTGKNANVKTIGVSWGFRPRKELENYHPYAIADTPCEIMDYILK